MSMPVGQMSARGMKLSLPNMEKNSLPTRDAIFIPISKEGMWRGEEILDSRLEIYLTPDPAYGMLRDLPRERWGGRNV